MKYIIVEELKNSIWNLRFFCGVVLILLTALAAEHSHLQFLSEFGVSAEGPGWFVAYSYFTNGANSLLFIPIAVPLAAGGDTETELRSRFFVFSAIRSGKNQYIIGKVCGLIFSGGLMACVAMGLLLAISCWGFGNLPALGGENDLSPFLANVILSFPRGFLNGALWATIGGLAAVVIRSRSQAYAVPFVIYYVLTVFQERYYGSLFFLNPRYWIAPVYYDNSFCILVLSVLCIMSSLLFMLATKRRLYYA